MLVFLLFLRLVAAHFISNNNLDVFGTIYEDSNALAGGFFEHGVASGDPTTSSVILWTRVSAEEPLSLSLYVSESETMDNSTVYTTYTTPEVDFTVKVDVDSLEPGKTYFYQFATTTDKSPVGRTRTLPEKDSMEEVKFAVYSCSNYAGGFFTSFAMPALKDSVDYVIHLGDYIYEHENGGYTDGTALGRTHQPDRELWTLEDYRERYASYRSDKDLQMSHSKFPWILVWDDHEVADNSWLRGSVNSSGLDFLKRREAALRAYFEWLPIRPQQDLYKIWRRLQFGGLVDLLMLDTRHYSRDVTDIYTNGDYIASIADREERTMMGFDQEAWLYESLRGPGLWKVLGSQTVIHPVDFSAIEIGEPFTRHNYDSFDGYTANRRRLVNAIAHHNVSNVAVVSGDFHISWVHEFGREGYEDTTGDNALFVEFATTAASSPTTFPKGMSIEECLEWSKELVSSNEGLLWNEGWYRGYLELTANEKVLEVEFFGTNVSNSLHEETKLAKFAVEAGANRVKRPLRTPYGFAK